MGGTRGTGSCHTYHARLTLAADAAEVEAQFVKVIGSIPAAFVDESAGKTGLLAEITLEHAPTAVAVMPFADRLFVADREGGLSAFATSTNALVRWTDLHLTDVLSVARLAVVPFTKRVYALDQAGDRVLVIDGETLDVIATIPVGRAPTAIAADQKANLIYVANFGQQSGGPDERAGSISVLDGSTATVVATVPTRGHPMAVDRRRPGVRRRARAQSVQARASFRSSMPALARRSPAWALTAVADPGPTPSTALCMP